jgi:hypothetical protein
MVAQLLAKYNLSIEECDLRENQFAQSETVVDDPVGARLWKIADGIAYMIEVRYWCSPPGAKATVSFFGFDHEVEIVGYLLDICRSAMGSKLAHLEHDYRLLRDSARRRRIAPFLDGMADRLRERIRDLKPPYPPGRGIVMLRHQLIDQAMSEAGLKLRDSNARASRDYEPDYARGRAVADGVALNPGLQNERAFTSIRRN